MGYSAVMLLPSIILLPIIAAAAGAAYFGARRFRLTPAGVPGIISYALIGCICYGLFFLYATAEMMIYQPARLQKEYLGAVFGTPVSLRDFDRSGFQDPISEWRYTLNPEDAALLSTRCKSSYRINDLQTCLLFSGMDERWRAEVLLEGRNLRIVEGLH